LEEVTIHVLSIGHTLSKNPEINLISALKEGRIGPGKQVEVKKSGDA